MPSYNKVTLIGNLTRDPAIKFLANEKAVANFGLAINEKYKGKDGETKESVTFVDIEAWGRTGELCGQYLTKGRACLVEGKLKLDTWEKDGQKHSKLKVVAEQVLFLGEKSEGGGGHAPSRPAASAAPVAMGDDEPPF
jgi:single-strand DNA-binding protein